MTLKQFIDTIRQKVSGLDYAADAYLNYANSVTGADDTNVGDAIMTLAAGYGQGGGGAYTIDTTVTMANRFDEIAVYRQYETLSDGKWLYGCMYSLSDQDTTSEQYSANFHASWNLARFNEFMRGILPITLTTNGNSATITSAPDLLRWRLRVNNGAGNQGTAIVSQGNTYNHQPGQYRFVLLCAD